MQRSGLRAPPLFVLLLASACAQPTARPVDARAQAVTGVKNVLALELVALEQALRALQREVPAPDADGWSPTSDTNAVSLMREHWKAARRAYAQLESHVAFLHPDLEMALDARYDAFLGGGSDPNLFDGRGVTGLHALERILWADSHPAHVVDFEARLHGYVPAAFPRTVEQARDFRDGLVAQALADTGALLRAFAPLGLDPRTAYFAILDSLEAQRLKAEQASTGEDESRYAQHTLADMRANLEGCRAIYAQYRPWLQQTPEGAAEDRRIMGALQRLADIYQDYPGDGLPTVPRDFSTTAPTGGTAYGRLYGGLVYETSSAEPDSLAARLRAGAALLGL